MLSCNFFISANGTELEDFQFGGDAEWTLYFSKYTVMLKLNDKILMKTIITMAIFVLVLYSGKNQSELDWSHVSMNDDRIPKHIYTIERANPREVLSRWTNKTVQGSTL